MGFALQAQVGPLNINDGSFPNATLRQSREGGLVVNGANGEYYEALARGNAFIATTLTAGIAIIVAAAGGGHPTLWNPQGSGYNAEFAELTLTYISGNNAPGGLYWASTQPAGSAIATGGPIATFASVAIMNALCGGMAMPVTGPFFWAPAVNTFTAAPVFWAPAGISLFTGVAATATAPFVLAVQYFGAIGVGPNAALSLTSQAATTTALLGVALHFVKARA